MTDSERHLVNEIYLDHVVVSSHDQSPDPSCIKSTTNPWRTELLHLNFQSLEVGDRSRDSQLYVTANRLES